MPLTETARAAVFQAQCRNVREIQASWLHLRRAANGALRRNDQAGLRAMTKVAALTFCAFSEAVLLKLIHTPHGLTLDEIQQVQRVRQGESTTNAWKKCIELALRYVQGSSGGFVHNTRENFDRLVDDFILKPAVLRNKIAHGQWKVALNRDGTALNHDLTNSLASLDLIVLERWYHAHLKLAEIVEWMIESPSKAFPQNYWAVIDSLKNELDDMSKWTIATKREQLLRKLPSRTG